ncbi:MAG: CHAT domain-containing protein, partial [Blastocatellia bacterium]|nr:CHAT domain-containing protein [Blastocatellia bacterium]
GNRAAAGDKLEVLNYAGDLLKRKGGDSFIHNLAGFYGKAKKRDLPLLSEARKLAGEGYKFYTVSNTNQAMEAYKQAKLLFERSGDDNEALLMKFYLGLCYILNLKSAIDIERSRIVFTQVARVSQENSFHWLHSAAQAGLTNYYNLCNEYSKAEDSCQLQKKLSEKIGDENGLLRDLQHLAYLYLRFGRYNESLKMIREGLLVSSRISADASETATLYSIGGDDYNALGCYAAALTYTQEALRLVKEIKHTKAISRDYVHLGMTYARLENYDEAIRNIKYGLESGSEQPESVSFASLFLGQIYRKMRLYDESISAITQAEKFYSQRKTDALLYMIAKEKLLTHIASGDVETAREELQSVIDIFENNRDKILEESNRNSYFDLEQPIYDVAINFVFSQLKEPLQALRYSELSRARSLLDAVSIKGQLIESEGSAPDIKYPSKTEPFLPGEIQRFIPEKAQIVEYAFLEDKLIIWLISKTKLEGRAVEISSKELNEKLKLYLQRISSPPNDQNEQSDLLVLNDAGDLYDLLVRPVAGMLDKDKVTCIVPDKMLYLLPFESLFSRESGKYLLEDYSIIYASSANLFLKCSEQARQKASARPEELLSVGNPRFDHQRFPELPDLPYAANEAERIADYYQHHSVYVDDAAVKSAILQGLKNADIVHLALHYMPDPQYPMLSQIPLAAGSAGDKRAREDGEVLAAYEIYRLKMPRTRLIVLSGCQTGVETWFNGEGPVGLSRTFLAKGIPLTVASLWPIEDSRATSDLMIRFHKGRKSEGLSTVKSLQLAKLALLKGPEKKCRRPFYWAPFTVTGGYSEF